MTFIEPLELETWIVSVFSGTPEIFTSLSILVIMGIAGYFRMRGITMFLMIGIFLAMFSDIIPFSILTLIMILAGLLIGYTISSFTSK